MAIHSEISIIAHAGHPLASMPATFTQQVQVFGTTIAQIDAQGAAQTAATAVVQLVTPYKDLFINRDLPTDFLVSVLLTRVIAITRIC